MKNKLWSTDIMQHNQLGNAPYQIQELGVQIKNVLQTVRRNLVNVHKLAAKIYQIRPTQERPWIYTTDLHHGSTPRIYTTNLQHGSTPGIYTRDLHPGEEHELKSWSPARLLSTEIISRCLRSRWTPASSPRLCGGIAERHRSGRLAWTLLRGQ